MCRDEVTNCENVGCQLWVWLLGAWSHSKSKSFSHWRLRALLVYHASKITWKLVKQPRIICAKSFVSFEVCFVVHGMGQEQNMHPHIKEKALICLCGQQWGQSPNTTCVFVFFLPWVSTKANLEKRTRGAISQWCMWFIRLSQAGPQKCKFWQYVLFKQLSCSLCFPCRWKVAVC